MVIFTANTQEAVLEATALQVILEFPLNVGGQWLALRRQRIGEYRCLTSAPLGQIEVIA